MQLFKQIEYISWENFQQILLFLLQLKAPAYFTLSTTFDTTSRFRRMQVVWICLIVVAWKILRIFLRHGKFQIIFRSYECSDNSHLIHRVNIFSVHSRARLCRVSVTVFFSSPAICFQISGFLQLELYLVIIINISVCIIFSAIFIIS